MKNSWQPHTLDRLASHYLSFFMHSLDGLAGSLTPLTSSVRWHFPFCCRFL